MLHPSSVLSDDVFVRERLVIAAGVALVSAGIALASWPFRYPLDLGDGSTVNATCRAPVIGAWNTEPKGQVGLWAVTVGTDVKGFEVRSDVGSGVGAYYASPARQRLATAVVAIVLGGTAVGVGGRRLRRHP